MRGLYLRVQGGEFDLQFSNAFLKTSRRLAIFTLQLHTARTHLMSLTCGYCCAMLPVLSVVQDVTVIQRRRKYPDVFWLDMPVVSLQSGGSDSVQRYEVQKHFHQGKGRGQKVQSTWSRGSAVFFFFCFTVKAGALCSQACCPERRGACCSRGRCCPEPGSC